MDVFSFILIIIKCVVIAFSLTFILFFLWAFIFHIIIFIFYLPLIIFCPDFRNLCSEISAIDEDNWHDAYHVDGHLIVIKGSAHYLRGINYFLDNKEFSKFYLDAEKNICAEKFNGQSVVCLWRKKHWWSSRKFNEKCLES